MADATPAAPADAAAAPAAAPAKKSKLLIIIVAAVVVLGAAGGGAFFFLGQGDDEAADTEETVADAEDADQGKDKGKAKGKGKDKGKGKKDKKKEPKPPAVYVKFEPPFVVNFEAKGMTRFLQVSVEVMTRDPHTADLIKENDPMMRNDLLMLLGSQTYETISTREGKEKLRGEALQTVAKIITDEGGDAEKVEQLYFTSFVMQ
jgi:flagellar FliL protein